MSIYYSQHRITTSASIFLLESEVSFKYHIGQIIKTSYCHLKNETILCPYLSLSVYEKLAQGFISSKLDDYNALLTGLPSGLITKLEQNSFAREVYLAKKRQQISLILASLHWLLRNKGLIVKLTCQPLHGQGPEYISRFNFEIYCFQASVLFSALLVQVPITKLQTLRDGGFYHYAQKLRNKLPFSV